MEVLLKILGQRMNVTEAVVFSRLYADMTTVSYYGKYSAVSDAFLSLLVHDQVTIIFVMSVGLSVCLCRVFLSRL